MHCGCGAVVALLSRYNNGDLLETRLWCGGSKEHLFLPIHAKTDYVGGALVELGPHTGPLQSGLSLCSIRIGISTLLDLGHSSAEKTSMSHLMILMTT